MSALRTGRLYPPGNIPGTHFCYRLSRPQSHSAAGRIMSTKNSNDTTGNRTRDLPACSAVPQPNKPPYSQDIRNYVLKTTITFIYASKAIKIKRYCLELPTCTLVTSLSLKRRKANSPSISLSDQQRISLQAAVCCLVSKKLKEKELSATDCFRKASPVTRRH